MKKKKMMAVAITAVILAIASAAYAISTQVDLQSAAGTEKRLENLKMQSAQKAHQILTAQQARVAALMPSEGALTETQYYTMIDWAAFLAEYEFTEEQLKAFDTLLADGITPYTIIDTYEFWLTTNEDFSLVTQIAAQEDSYIGEHWIENVFNEITNYKTGVLELEDIEQYLEQGLTIGDISAANVLCRKGIMTIQDILEARLAGANWATLTQNCQIQIPEVQSTVKASKGFENGNTQIAAQAAIEKYGIDVTNLPENEAAIQLRQMEQEAQEMRLEAAKAAVAKLGVDEARLVCSTEEQDEADRAAAMENGFGRPYIQAMLHRGFSYAEIRQASELCLQNEALEPCIAVKQVRNGKEAE